MTDKPENWPPRFRMTWVGLLRLCAGQIQKGTNSVGEDLLDEIGAFLDKQGIEIIFQDHEGGELVMGAER